MFDSAINEEYIVNLNKIAGSFDNIIEDTINNPIELISESAIASYYHDKFNGRKTASGKVFNNNKYIAAHRKLPFGSKVKVTNLINNKSVILEIWDSGPFHKKRSIDISKKAFMDIAHNKGIGLLKIKIELLK